MKINKVKKINGFELIDQDRYTWAREEEDGGYTFVGLRQIGDDDNFNVQTGSYNASDDIEQDPWGVFSAVWQEGYGMNPDGYNDKEHYLDYLDRHYPDVELTVDKCLFWQDYDNEEVCQIQGWGKACLKVEGLCQIM